MITSPRQPGQRQLEVSWGIGWCGKSMHQQSGPDRQTKPVPQREQRKETGAGWPEAGKAWVDIGEV